jgi:threonylcarbamoyladenosine tRNA methylthiotransferase MtaB
MKKVGFHTLGCKVNFAESSTLARRFAADGFTRVGTAAGADLYVVNTCAVTAAAEKKSRNLISRLHRRSPSAEIIVTGCYASLVPDTVRALPGVTQVFTNDRKGEIAGNVAPCEPKATRDVNSSLFTPHSSFNYFPAHSSGERTRSFLKVQDGCDYCCAYCTIHYARGGSRNPSIASLVAQAREIAARGIKEIVLTGVNTGDFGHTTGERFIDLLRALDGVEGIERYRISSIEPNLLTDEIIDFCASSRRFMPHFHIPLQSGSDRVLGLMRRRYTTAKFADRLARVRSVMPETFFGVDVIVGFPGERDADFEDTYRFLERVRPAELHVFPYSVRPGTPAAAMPDRVPPAVAAARAARLGELSRELHAEFVARFAGTRALVLFEATTVAANPATQHVGGRGSRMMCGFTGNYIKVCRPYDPALVNRIVETEL